MDEKREKIEVPRASGGLFPKKLFPDSLFPSGMFGGRPPKSPSEPSKVQPVEFLSIGTPGSISVTVTKVGPEEPIVK